MPAGTPETSPSALPIARAPREELDTSFTAGATGEDMGTPFITRKNPAALPTVGEYREELDTPLTLAAPCEARTPREELDALPAPTAPGAWLDALPTDEATDCPTFDVAGTRVAPRSLCQRTYVRWGRESTAQRGLGKEPQ